MKVGDRICVTNDASWFFGRIGTVTDTRGYCVVVDLDEGRSGPALVGQLFSSSELHQYLDMPPVNHLDGTAAERKAWLDAMAAWLPSGSAISGDSLFGIDRSAGSRTITSVDKTVGTITPVAPHPGDLARALFNRRMRDEAESVADAKVCRGVIRSKSLRYEGAAVRHTIHPGYEYVKDEAARIANVLDVMWTKTKLDVRAECEAEAKAICDEYDRI